MKQYSIFTLQRNIGKALEELPFQITKHGKIVAVVNRYNVDSSTLNKPATKSLLNKINVVQQAKGLNLCEHGFPFGLCKKGCK